MNNLELNKIHEQKYLKYKAKYLNAVKIMHGGGKLTVEYIIDKMGDDYSSMTDVLLLKYYAWFQIYDTDDKVTSCRDCTEETFNHSVSKPWFYQEPGRELIPSNKEKLREALYDNLNQQTKYVTRYVWIKMAVDLIKGNL